LPNIDSRCRPGRFNNFQDTEYADVRERIADLMDGIATETRGRRASYVQWTSTRPTWSGFAPCWLGKTAGRDYFGARGRATAQTDVERCARALAEFEATLPGR
jgi:hypothetical protein